MSRFSADDHRHMARALQLARLGLNTTDPNPRVGCVIVNAGEVVGEGWHERAGEPHAEVHALRAAGERARGATAYVTLEPCSHHGRTPPCADALIEAGVARVVAAMQDPNPQVAGSGLARLQGAGITAEAGLMQAEAEALNPGFIKRMRDGRPLLRCKLAMSLDGRTAMASGESFWITGPAAREDVQRLRARSSAIVTGIGTVLADDPAMTVRSEALGESLRQPMRVVLDPHLSTPPTAKIIAAPGVCLIVTAAVIDNDSEEQAIAEALRAAGAELAYLPNGSGDGIDLKGLMSLLAERECNEVLLESGATLSGAALRAGFIDELIVYTAPKLMGDAARGLFHLPGLEHMAESVALEFTGVSRVGEDLRISARVCADTAQ